MPPSIKRLHLELIELSVAIFTESAWPKPSMPSVRVLGPGAFLVARDDRLSWWMIVLRDWYSV
jgi:hypothetical protein